MSQPLLFDMDGVVLEGPRTDPQVYAEATETALADLGAEPTADQRRAIDRGGTDAVVDVCRSLGVDPDRFWERRDRYASEGTHERLRSGDRGRYDDVDAIRELADGTTTALVTNNRHATARFVDDYFDLEFDAVRGRDPTLEGFDRRKPDPYYLEETLAELGVDDGLYVGDSPKDVAAGTAAGLETAFLRRPHNRNWELPADASREITSLRELLPP